MEGLRKTILALVFSALGVAGGFVAQDYRAKFSGSPEYEQLVSAEEGIKAPDELKVAPGEPKRLQVETLGKMVQFVPLQKEIHWLPIDAHTAWVWLDPRAKVKDDKGQSIQYQMMCYSAVNNRPTPYRLTNLVVEEEPSAQEAKK